MAGDIIIRFGGGLRVDTEYHGFIIKTDQPHQEGGLRSFAL
jgi:hypothetical protein